MKRFNCFALIFGNNSTKCLDVWLCACMLWKFLGSFIDNLPVPLVLLISSFDVTSWSSTGAGSSNSCSIKLRLSRAVTVFAFDYPVVYYTAAVVTGNYESLYNLLVLSTQSQQLLRLLTCLSLTQLLRDELTQRYSRDSWIFPTYYRALQPTHSIVVQFAQQQVFDLGDI